MAKVISAALFGLHLFLLVCVSLQDLSSALGKSAGLSPSSAERIWRLTDLSTAALLGERFNESNLLRQAIATYADVTGIDAGYSYFAPSVPGHSQLYFEVHYADGRVEYDLPIVSGSAAGYRVSASIDQLGRIRYRRLREEMLKAFVYPVRQEHPDAVMIRAVYRVAELPTVAEYKSDKAISYRTLFSYDFSFRQRKD